MNDMTHSSANNMLLVSFHIIQTITEKDYLTYLVFTIIKIASISEASGEALNIATELIRDCYAHAEQNNQVIFAI